MRPRPRTPGPPPHPDAAAPSRVGYAGLHGSSTRNSLCVTPKTLAIKAIELEAFCASISSKRCCFGDVMRRRRWLFPKTRSPSPTRAPADAEQFHLAWIRTALGHGLAPLALEFDPAAQHRLTQPWIPSHRCDRRPRIQHQRCNITTILRSKTTTRTHNRYPLSAGTHTCFTKCQQHQPKPTRCPSSACANTRSCRGCTCVPTRDCAGIGHSSDSLW